MRTSFLLVSSVLLVLATISGSWISATQEEYTTKGTFQGYFQDPDYPDDSYYSFETDDDYLDFYSVDKSVLSSYDLKSSEFNRATFTIKYTVEEETGDMTLKKLTLISKAKE